MVGNNWFLMPKLISGVKSDEAMKIQTINPATEQVIGEYETVTEEQVHTEVRNSREIFEKEKRLIYQSVQSY